MQKYIIGKKVGMTQLFDENGKFIPVTVIEAGPCIVTQKKTIENDGYEAVQIGYGEVSDKHLNKPQKGHFAKADVAAKKHLKEFRADNCGDLNVGDLIKADTFAAGDKVDVCGISKGKGYQGVIKRFWRTLPQGYPRFRPCAQTCRFQRFHIDPQPCIQGQDPARSHGFGAGNCAEPGSSKSRRRA